VDGAATTHDCRCDAMQWIAVGRFMTTRIGRSSTALLLMAKMAVITKLFFYGGEFILWETGKVFGI
jgi:hypothetical protein